MELKSLKPYDILLYKGKSFTSWLITVLTTSPYCHVAIVVDPQMHLGIESNTGHQSGVRAFDLRKLDKISVDVFRIKSQYPFDGKKVASYLVNCLGARYDFLGVFFLGLLKLLSLLTLGSLKFHNEFQRQKDYFCSELCYDAFMAGGLDLVPQIGEADITSPCDIAESPLVEKIV